MGYGYGNRIAVGRRAITAQAQAEQVIWKVAIFGAGTTTSNGEYIWDGTTLENGKPKYLASNNNYIYWASPYWSLFDYTEDRTTYASFESLTSWEIDDALEPAPSSALSYAQDSFISSFELDSAVAETFSRASGGNTTFTSGTPAIYVTVSGATLSAFNDDIIPEIALYVSTDSGFNWSDEQGFPPVPNISAVVYSA